MRLPDVSNHFKRCYIFIGQVKISPHNIKRGNFPFAPTSDVTDTRQLLASLRVLLILSALFSIMTRNKGPLSISFPIEHPFPRKLPTHRPYRLSLQEHRFTLLYAILPYHCSQSCVSQVRIYFSSSSSPLSRPFLLRININISKIPAAQSLAQAHAFFSTIAIVTLERETFTPAAMVSLKAETPPNQKF